nr:hypothetical protein DA06_05925 [Georgenia sp. SUBG003]
MRVRRRLLRARPDLSGRPPTFVGPRPLVAGRLVPERGTDVGIDAVVVRGGPRVERDERARARRGVRSADQASACRRSATSASTRVLISSRTGRTPSTLLPAGSSSCQSS